MSEPTQQTFTDGPLTLVLAEHPSELRLSWQGMSMAREPARFLMPILSRALDLGAQQKKPLVIDFQRLEYLNSSTLSPVIRALEQARRGQNRVKVLYDKGVKWQSLSFTGLDIFKTPDARIDVEGV